MLENEISIFKKLVSRRKHEVLQNVMVNGWFFRLCIFFFHTFSFHSTLLTAAGSDLRGADACPFSPDKRDKHDRSIRIENNSQCTHSEPSKTECALDIVTHCRNRRLLKTAKRMTYSVGALLYFWASWAIWSNRLPFHTCFIHRSCRLHSQMCALVCAAWSSLEGEQRYFHLSCCSLVECFCKYLVNMEGLNLHCMQCIQIFAMHKVSISADLSNLT